MKPTPKGWPRIAVAIFYEDPAAAIDWLCRAFGFQVRLKVEGEGGSIVHSELEYGEGVVMVAGVSAERRHQSPRAFGGANTQNLMIYVDDLDAHLARAKEAGARITMEPKVSDYGEEYWSDRSYQAEDPDGHRWYFSQRLRG
jgi:uncharacterized glyoxalase superfamily protein PhnB